jgi:outer membrane protein assembly factor BamB
VRVQDAKAGALKWESDFDLDHTYDINLTVAISDRDHILVTAGYSQGLKTFEHVWQVVSAYDTKSGKLIWRDILGDASTDYYPFQIAIRGGKAYVAGIAGATCATIDSTTCDMYTRVYDVASGTILSSLRDDVTGSDDEALSVAVEDRLMILGGYIGTGPQDTIAPAVRAYDAKSGALVWADVMPDTSQAGFVFKVVTHDNQVVAAAEASNNWLIRCYDARTGDIRWSQTYSLIDPLAPDVIDGPVQLAVAEGIVLAAGFGAIEPFEDETYPHQFRYWVVRAYDADTGRLLWSDHTGTPTGAAEANGGALIVDGHAYALGYVTDVQGVQHTLVRAYELRSGRVIWQDELAASGNPFGVSVTLSAKDGKLSAVSFVQGTRPPGTTGYDSFGRNLLVRTYDISEDGSR